MWRLEPTDSVESLKKTWLLPGKFYKIGRKGSKDCDIPLDGDKSISRNHAELIVKKGNLCLKDISKYGTFVNEDKVQGSSEIHLSEGDVVKFGRLSNEFRVTFTPFVFVCSGMTKQEKKDLTQLSAKIGGLVRTDWDECCTHLLMKSITVTIKAIEVLVSCKRIVHPNWLGKAFSALKAQQDLPDINGFLPEVAETSLFSDTVSFSPDVRRKKIFENLKFIFLVETPKTRKFSCLIRKAAGTCQFSTKAKDVESMDTLIQSDTFIFDDDGGGKEIKQQSWIAAVKSYLAEHGRCLVKDADVGLAVLHVSVNHLPTSLTSSQFQPSVGASPTVASNTLASRKTAMPTPPVVAATPAPDKKSEYPPPVVASVPEPITMTQPSASSRKIANSERNDSTLQNSQNPTSKSVNEKHLDKKPEQCSDSVPLLRDTHSNTESNAVIMSQDFSDKKPVVSQMMSPKYSRDSAVKRVTSQDSFLHETGGQFSETEVPFDETVPSNVMKSEVRKLVCRAIVTSLPTESANKNVKVFKKAGLAASSPVISQLSMRPHVTGRSAASADQSADVSPHDVSDDDCEDLGRELFEWNPPKRRRNNAKF